MLHAMLADFLDEPALVIYDGSPAAAAVAGLLREPGRSALWLAPALPGVQRALAASAQRVADATGVRRIVPEAQALGSGSSSLDHARVLLDAVDAANTLGLARVLHPAALGDAELDAIAAMVDRCSLITALAQLTPPERRQDAPSPIQATIQAPMIDLTDAQVAELLMDLALPLALCAVCETGSEQPCQACPGCRRWAKALESARTSFRVADAVAAAQSR